MKRLRRYLPWATVAFFLFLLLLSLSAGITGFDPDNRWGTFRLASSLFGAAGLIGIACLQLIRNLDERALSKPHAIARTQPESETRLPSSQAESVSPSSSVPPPAMRNRRLTTLAVVAFTVALVGVTYVGLVSAWHWTEWPPTTTGYASLAAAFTQGRTYIEDDFTDVDVNLSYFEGRIYMYWGPVPAVVLAVLRMLGVPEIGDEVVGFVAICFIFLFSSLIVLRLRRVYFQRLPLWLLITGLVTVATIHPMLWFQNSPGLMTAAIACGQAFLVGGVYFLARALTHKSASALGFAAAGTLWALAITSRPTTAVPVTVLVLGAGFLSARRAAMLDSNRDLPLNLLSMLAPLLIVLGLYGWYNEIRFDSPFETGWRYQIYNATRFGYPFDTKHPQIPGIDRNNQEPKGSPFGLDYLVPNTFYHFLAPVRPISTFPYLRAVYDEYPLFSQLLRRLSVPATYVVEDAAGLVFAAPALLFALTFARKLLYQELPRCSPADSAVIAVAGGATIDQGALGALILLSGLAGIIPVILLFFSTTRYEMDFVPLLAIVAVLGMWRLHEDTRPLPIQSRLATCSIVLVMTVGTLVSFLLAASGSASRLDDLNPDLLLFLVNSLPQW